MNSSANHLEYEKALRLGQKEKKALADAGRDPYPAVLDEVLPDLSVHAIRELGIIDIPADRIVGTVAAGRVNAFSAGFYPLLEENSEFGQKWIALCGAHLSETGIREPILCYEYLGDFYVQEGNKRVSVLKYFGAARIPAKVRRVMPLPSDDPRIRAYGEFLDFYALTGLYDIQFRKPGSYARLLAFLGRDDTTAWTDLEKRALSSRWHFFKEAFNSLEKKEQGLYPEEALLLWLKVHPYEQLSSMSAKELKASLAALWGDVIADSGEGTPSVVTEPQSGTQSVLEKIISPAPSHLNIAFVYKWDSTASHWARAHERGAKEMEEALAPQVKVCHYFHADTAEEAEALIGKAVGEGAELVFTTTPQLLRETLKAAVRYPKVRFLNCSIDTTLSSVRSYYCRTFEGKFITGLIAGALADTNEIGYIGSYPILGVPASVNAFALGARMTNPRAKVILEWSCLPGDPAEKLLSRGVKVVSNRDIPLQNKRYLSKGLYGTYLMNDEGQLTPLASPVWLWGKLYENIVRSVLDGSWKAGKNPAEAVNYWWGMSSGVIDVEFSDLVPEGVRSLAEFMMREIREGRFDPFARRITAQDGTMKNDGSHGLSPLELVRMDWLCDSVEGRIPSFEELSPISQPLVRELGVYRESIPPEKEESR